MLELPKNFIAAAMDKEIGNWKIFFQDVEYLKKKEWYLYFKV